jgi:hypothetical protein
MPAPSKSARKRGQGDAPDQPSHHAVAIALHPAPTTAPLKADKKPANSECRRVIHIP